MKPTDDLVHDHKIILQMLSGAEKIAYSMKATRTVDVQKIQDMIDFSRNFTDGCHHSKEERFLFVKLQERGMPTNGGPIAVMLHEHGMGRELIAMIESSLNQYRAGNVEAVDPLCYAMLKYIELLRAHIDKENTILFPMSERFLSPDDQASLSEAFRIIEEQEVGLEVHEKYHQIAHRLGE